MQKRNFGQAKKQRENARKVRQQQKLERKHSRTQKPAESAPGVPETAGKEPVDPS